MPDCALRIKAAIRTLRAEGAKLGLNGKIVPVGFSRGSGMALMLLTTEGMPEFEGLGEHTAEKSNVQIDAVTKAKLDGLQAQLNSKPDSAQIAAIPTGPYSHLTTGTPIILDLNGDGVRTQSIDAGVKFDLFADGSAINTGGASTSGADRMSRRM